MKWLDRVIAKLGLGDSSSDLPPQQQQADKIGPERRKTARRKSDVYQVSVTSQRSIWGHTLDTIASAGQSVPDSNKDDQSEKQVGLRSPGPTKVWYDLWLNELIRQVSPGVSASKEPSNPDLVNQSTERMVVTIFDALTNLIAEFNNAAGTGSQKVSITEPKLSQNYCRFRLSTATWSLTARGQRGVIEFFLLPASELINMSENETASRLRATLQLNTQTSPSFWSVNGMPLDVHESRVLVRNLFKDLIFRTAGELKSSTQSLSPSVDMSGDKMTQILHDMAIEKQNLVQKIVIQQEEIQKRIARDLHDTVISDVMMLKRALSESSFDKAKVTNTLDGINGKLREICHDLAPRDLIDWGLQPVIEDLLQRVAEETGADCSFSCDCQMPELPESVQLHIFRIIQESLNNTVKYAEATRIQVRIDRKDGELIFSVEDNGKGFSEEDTEARLNKEGGFGLGGMNERIDLIRCFYPARLSVESQPGAGTKSSLVLAIG